MNILHQIPSESKIKRELKRIVFGKRMFCPFCRGISIKKYDNRYRCRRCRKPFSFKSVCWLKGMKLSYQVFWLILWCWINKVPTDQAMKISGVSKPTLYRWYAKFREHIPKERLTDIRLTGIVQMDEAYRGGKKKGYAIIGAKQKAQENKDRKMVLQVIDKPSVDRKDVISFLSQSVVPGSNLHTDGYSVYRGIDNWWSVKHSYEIHSKWEFALTSEIEGLWGNLTTFVRRMYHHVTRDKVESVVQEFTARQVYPQWFKNPQSYLEISLKPCRKPSKRKNENCMNKTSDFPCYSLTNQSSYVPS